MNSMESNQPISVKKVNYGLDAPIFQRSALFGGMAAVLMSLVLSRWNPGHSPNVLDGLVSAMFWAGLSFFATGCAMYWGSKVGKLRLRDKMIASIAWRGDERVLDVGCGHGMMLLAAAKQLTTGSAVGIDIWSQADQADNSPEATLGNARIEDVADRVQVQSADVRKLPFADSTFDVVVSSFVIHNMQKAADRQLAVQEIARVLKPGGQLAIADIRHTSQYAKTLQSLGWTRVQRWLPNFLFVTPTRVLRATKP